MKDLLFLKLFNSSTLAIELMSYPSSINDETVTLNTIQIYAHLTDNS